MLDEEIYASYQAARREFYYPPTVLTLTDEGEEIFISNAVITLPRSIPKDVKQLRIMFHHELCHMDYCPGSVTKGIEIFKAANDVLMDAEDAHLSANIFADNVVNERIVTQYGDDLPYLWKTYALDEAAKRFFEGEARKKKAADDTGMLYSPKTVFEPNPLLAIQTRVYELISKQNFAPFPVSSELNEFAERLLAASRENAPFEERSREFAKIFAELLKKLYGDAEASFRAEEAAFESEVQEKARGKRKQLTYRENVIAAQQVRKMLAELVEALEEFGGHPFKEDGGPESKEKKKNAVKESQPKSLKEFKELCYGVGLSFGVDLDAFDYYLSKARINVRFKARVLKPAYSRTSAGSLEAWTLDDKAEDLEVEESLSESGVIIPEATTLQHERKKGFEEIGFANPRVLLVLDTSGSITIEDGLVTAFSIIEACKLNALEFAVILFSEKPYYTRPFSRSYLDAEQDIYHSYTAGGTQIARAAQRAQGLLENAKRSLLIFVSDFSTNDADYRDTLQILSELRRTHFVKPLVLRDSRSKVEVPGGVEVYKASELQEIVIDTFNTLA